MKTTLTILAFIFASFYSVSQEKKELTIEKTQKTPTAKSKERISVSKEKGASKPITISKRAGEPQRVHDNSYYLDEIKKIDANILAIDTKISLVNADSVEKTKALESGWFDNMDNIKRRLNAKKKIYQEKITK
ncbi:MAG: hypothetical protein COA33_003790 [Fluviicola sp.]|nr:hypothetical protein [Fluviicola sp.]